MKEHKTARRSNAAGPAGHGGAAQQSGPDQGHTDLGAEASALRAELAEHFVPDMVDQTENYPFLASAARETGAPIDAATPDVYRPAVAHLAFEAEAVEGSMASAAKALREAEQHASPEARSTVIDPLKATLAASRGAPYSETWQTIIDEVYLDRHDGVALPQSAKAGGRNLPEAVENHRARIDPVMDQIDVLRTLTGGAQAAEGAEAFDAATGLVTGPMSAFPLGSPEYTYLSLDLAASDASDRVKRCAAFLLGDDVDEGVGLFGNTFEQLYLLGAQGGLRDLVDAFTGGDEPVVRPTREVGPQDHNFTDEQLGFDAHGMPTAVGQLEGKNRPKLKGAKIEPEVQAGQDKRVAEGVTSNKVGAKFSGTADSPAAELNAGHTYTRDDGGETQLGASGKLSADGPTSGTLSFKDKGKGQKESTSVAITGDSDGNAQVAVGMPISGKESASFTGKIGDDELSGEVGYKKGDWSVKVGADSKRKVKDPELRGGVWVVAYEQHTGSKTSGGVSKGKSDKVGGTVGFDTTSMRSGVKAFATEEEAKAFHLRGEVGPTDTDLSVADVLALQPGEERSETTGGGASAGGSASTGSLSVGAGFQGSSSSGRRVVRGQGNEVLVEVSEAEDQGVSGNAGVGVAGASKGKQWGERHSRSVAFDLGDPQGQLAYTLFMQTGAAPESLSGQREVARNHTESEGKSWGMTFTPGLSFSESNTHTSGEMIKNGQKTEYDVGTERSRLAIWGLGHLERSHTLNAWQVDDEEAFYTVSSSVDASDSDDAAKGLARATSQESAVDPKGDSDGAWTVRSTFSQTEIDRFVAYAKTDAFWWITDSWGNNEGSTLRSRLRKASGDPDAEREALAQFVSEAGGDALERMREATGGAADFHLELKGDAYWTGLQGHVDLEHHVDDWALRLSQAGTDKWAVYYEAQEKAVYLRDKIATLPGYRDVPDHLLRPELERSRAILSRVNGIMDAAAQLRTDPNGATEDAMVDDPTLAQVMAMRRSMVEQREQIETPRRNAVRHHESIFDGFRRRSRTRKASGYLEENESVKPHLDKAGTLFEQAEQQYARAEVYERELDTMRLEENPRRALGMVTRATFSFKRARPAFEESFRIMKDISDWAFFDMSDELRGTVHVKPM